MRVGLHEGSKCKAKAEERGPAGGHARGGRRRGRRHHDPGAGPDPAPTYATSPSRNLNEGDALFFGHGLNIRYGLIKPPAGVDVCMVAPKGPGHLVRRQYEEGRGVPCIAAVEQDASGNGLRLALSYAKAIGGTRAGVTQDHLHRGDRDRPVRRAGRALRRPAALVKAGFETLVEAGYQPEIAYFECLHELKLIVDLMYEGGISKDALVGLRHRRVGRLHQRPAHHHRRHQGRDEEDPRRDPGRHLRQRAGWRSSTAGRAEVQRHEAEQAEHLLEKTGTKLRKLMSWLKRLMPATAVASRVPGVSTPRDPPRVEGWSTPIPGRVIG